jgi:tetratricopeptide (TPR) repeat protein
MDAQTYRQELERQVREQERQRRAAEQEYKAAQREAAAAARAQSREAANAALRADPARFIPRPGLFASQVEKRYREGAVAIVKSDYTSAVRAFEEVLATNPHLGSAHLIAGLGLARQHDDAGAIAHFEAVAITGEPLPDQLQAKYLPAGRITLGLPIPVTSSIVVQAPFDALGAALMLAELYQEAGRLDEAIGLLQQLHETSPGPAIVLSLADLLFADNDLDAVIELTTGAPNEDDVGAAILHLRAAAMFAKGLHAAAFDVFKDALARTSERSPELLKTIRYDRALAYDAAGQHGRARRDLERIYAQDPAFQDVRERLAAAASN